MKASISFILVSYHGTSGCCDWVDVWNRSGDRISLSHVYDPVPEN
jgi:hypothetical protein